MEANFGGEGHQFFAAGSSNRYGKKTLEWDLNDWKWDGDLFMAAPVNPGPLNCLKKQLFPEIVLSNSSSSCSDEAEFGIVGKAPGEEDKRRRIVVAEDDERCDDTQSLTLKLGAQAYPVMEKDLNFIELKNRKRGMVETSNSNYPKCQAENCSADLSQSKDYHRRHKVCEMHAKAGSAIVRNAVQRFCQQCSRFHLLQEFDEGKRSCRRRLAGHNKRRRKILSDASPSGSTAAGDQSAGYLLISLLRIIANLNSDRSEQSNDQEFLSKLLKNIASLAGSSDGNNSFDLHQVSHDLQKVGTSTDARTSGAVPIKENIDSIRSPPHTVCDPHAMNHCGSLAITNHCASPAITPREIHGPQKLTYMLPNAGASKKGFDLNTMHYEEDGVLGCRQIASQTAPDIHSSNFPSWMLHDFHQSSPPQTSANTDSTSNRSPSSSNGDAQGRTDRIVFKLFGKDPNDFPLGLRAQIFNWLSSSPADMESYIRPGCIILTVYFRLEMSMWNELCHDFGSTLKKLLSLTDDNFWRIGWIYVRLQHYFTFIYNGQVVLNRSLIMERAACGRILSVTPIAVPPSSTVTFKVKCSNLVRSALRLLCAIEGKYLIQETKQNPVDHFSNTSDRGTDEHLEFLSFSCCVPNTIGRGFIEIEDNGLSSDFFPFMVAEEDLCTEIQVLESSIASSSEDKILELERSMALNFLNEMGWLLHRTSLRSVSGSNNICSEASFSLSRYRWILRFSIDRNWSAVVKKLLDILFEGRCIETAGSSPSEVACSEGLLHYAVQKKADSTVKLLLKYKSGLNYLFRPDMLGPAGITPLHVAASSSLSESTLDILTDDPGQFGVKAWSNARDNAGFTPEEYARAGGRESYVLLMRKKIDNATEKYNAVVSIPAAKFSLAVLDGLKSGQPPRSAVKKAQSKQQLPPLSCRLCEQRSAPRSSLLYRPMLLSMVGIAAVCVCVGLLFKGPPEVIFVYPPFRWELLESGYI